MENEYEGERAQTSAQGLRLNLGCGFNKKTGMVNVDQSESCIPDMKCNLARDKWPWADGAVSEVYFDFSMEQMGEVASDLLHVLSELYRVCSDGAHVFIKHLHPRHDQFALNPLCVHTLSPQFFQLLSIGNNMNMMASGAFDNYLAFQLGVNFSVTRFKFLLVQEFEEQMKNLMTNEEQLRRRMHFENNICHAVEVDLVVHKGHG